MRIIVCFTKHLGMKLIYNIKSEFRRLLAYAGGIILVALLFGGEVWGQSNLAGQDFSSNYGDDWNGNEGFGFSAWNLYISGGTQDDAGHFLGNSTADGHGNINASDGRSFGMYGNNNAYANAERTLEYWGDGYSFFITLAVQWRDGGRGISLFNNAWDQIWNFDISNAGYGSTGWDYQADMVLEFRFTQVGNNIQIQVTGSSEISSWTNTFSTTVSNQTLKHFRIYTGGHNLGNAGERNLYVNHLKITANSFAPTENLTLRNLTIPANTTFNLNGQQLTIEENGTFKNHGTFIPGTGTVVFKDNTEVTGDSTTPFYIAVVDTDNPVQGVNFGEAKSTISHQLIIQSGFVNDHAPALEENSTLLYQTSGGYNRGIEWNTPWHVQVANETHLNLNISAFVNNLTMGGNLIIDENSSVSVDAGHTQNLEVHGDLTLNGTLTLSEEIGSDLHIGGNWTSTGTFTPNNREVIFNGSETQEITGTTSFDYLRIDNTGAGAIMNDPMEVTKRLVVEENALLHMGEHIISGEGTFELKSRGRLAIGHPNGITLSGSTGNIQTSGTRTFAPEATYHYVGSENQRSGDALPRELASKNIIVELKEDHHELTINVGGEGAIEIDTGGSLEIRSGTLVETQQNISSESKRIDGTGNLVMSGGKYLITSIGSTTHKPRISGDYDLSEGTIILGANGEQLLRGGSNRHYHNLTFKNQTISKISSGIPHISGTVTIQDQATVDSENKTFGDKNTDLTMSGGRLILTGARTLPDMAGDYNLTGGTIEFAGSSVDHKIRGEKTYFNIDITGTVNSPSDDVTIAENGTIAIKEDGVFSISNQRSILGDGNFHLEEGGTLLYGSSGGINTSGEAGNIRVTGTRTFNPDATYGFIGGVNQVTGDALPATVQNLVVSKTNSDYHVTFSRDITITGELRLNQGVIHTGEHLLHLSNGEPTSLVAETGNENFENSYIIGQFRRDVTEEGQDYAFPVGRESHAQTAVVNFTNLAHGTLTASFITPTPQTPAFYANLPDVFDDISINTLSGEGYWQLDASNEIGNSNYTLSLFANGFNNMLKPENIRIMKKDGEGNNWDLAGTSGGYSGTEGSYIFSHTGITGFSFFTFGSNYADNPLPVEWLSFEARLQHPEVHLHWQTASETNNNYFTVLRSGDGHQFEAIGQLPGAGNSNQLLRYQFTDTQPMPGISYYRVRQIDFDGQTDYSQTVAVQNLPSQHPVQVYTHQGQIHIHLPQNHLQQWHYQLHNPGGIRLASGQIAPHQDQIILDATPWQAQLLIISLHNGETVLHEKLLIR